MRRNLLLILAAVSAAIAAPNPAPQASCSIQKVNQCISQVRFRSSFTIQGYRGPANWNPLIVQWQSLRLL